MIELNYEEVEDVLYGLKVLRDFSYLHDDVKLNINKLRCTGYSDVTEWLFEIISSVFAYKLEIIKDIFIEDVDLIHDIVYEYSTDAYSYYYENFRELYGYTTHIEGIEDNVQYQKDYIEYYQNLNIKMLEFTCPLIDSDSVECRDFIDKIPLIIEKPFMMFRSVLLNIHLKYNIELKKYVVVVYYVEDRNGDFAQHISVFELIESFKKLFEFHKRRYLSFSGESAS